MSNLVAVFGYYHDGPAVELVEVAVCRAKTKPIQPARLQAILVEQLASASERRVRRSV